MRARKHWKPTRNTGLFSWMNLSPIWNCIATSLKWSVPPGKPCKKTIWPLLKPPTIPPCKPMFPSAGDLSIKANITYRLSPSSKILTWSCKPIRNTSRRKSHRKQPPQEWPWRNTPPMGTSHTPRRNRKPPIGWITAIIFIYRPAKAATTIPFTGRIFQRSTEGSLTTPIFLCCLPVMKSLRCMSARTQR